MVRGLSLYPCLPLQEEGREVMEGRTGWMRMRRSSQP
jgi:hypothetical protein